jgi:hypothetical protein
VVLRHREQRGRRSYRGGGSRIELTAPQRRHQWHGHGGQPFSFLVTTTGSPTPKIKAKGKLPKGSSSTTNGDGTAIVSGMPTSTRHKSAGGLYPLTFTATFGKGHAKVVSKQSWTLDVTM